MAWLACEKSGTPYRYYLPAREQEHAGPSSLPCLPAAGLEAAVVEQLHTAGAGVRGPRWWPGDPTLTKAHITVAMLRLGQILDQFSPVEQPRIARLLVEKVIVSPRDIEVRLRANRIEEPAPALRPACAGGGCRMTKFVGNEFGSRSGPRSGGLHGWSPQPDPQQQDRQAPSHPCPRRPTKHLGPIQIKRRSGRKLVTHPNGGTATSPPWNDEPTPMHLPLARGHRWLAMLESGVVKLLRKLARRGGVDSSYASRVVNLTTWRRTSSRSQ